MTQLYDSWTYIKDFIPYYRDSYTTMFIPTQFTIARQWNQLNVHQLMMLRQGICGLYTQCNITHL